MDVQVNDVISTCMSLGVMVSINQRLDAETMSIVADEFGYKVEFVSAEVLETIVEEVKESSENLQPRPLYHHCGLSYQRHLTLYRNRGEKDHRTRMAPEYRPGYRF